MRPEATKIDVHLGGAGVGEQQPSTENWLGEDVEDGVGDDLLIDVHLAAAVGNTPDTMILLVEADRSFNVCTYIG